LVEKNWIGVVAAECLGHPVYVGFRNWLAMDGGGETVSQRVAAGN
jgi:hypothetical protein